MSPQPPAEVASSAAEQADQRVPDPGPVGSTALVDGADDVTVSIELNFNAFADHCPPTQHARRVARATDPSVQDFADQALEVAALRMELKRLNRECDALRHAVQVRDARLQLLRDKARLARDPIADAPKVPPRAAVTLDNSVARDELSHTLDLLLANTKGTPPVATSVEGPTATLMPPPEQGAPTEPPPAGDTPKLRLIPVDHEGEPILLSRDIMTIGRTRDKDICILSRGVSRDHARLVVSARNATIFDMDSANGCFVNDEPVRRHKLRDNDILRIGDRSYRFACQ